MRELRSCDFCGDDAAGIFEVLPPEFTPAADQRRVILCPSCQETLTDVIEPLISRLGSTTDTPDSGLTHEAAEAPSQSTPARIENVASADDDGVEATPESVADPLEAPTHAENGRVSDSASNLNESTAGEEQSTDDESAPSTETDEKPHRPEPPKFRQVIRILQNREFPVNRAKVEDLAANAYALEDDEVRDIFEYAIERELLEEENGQLRKT